MDRKSESDAVLSPAWPPSVRKHELTTLLAIGIADLVKRIKPRVLRPVWWAGSRATLRHTPAAAGVTSKSAAAGVARCGAVGVCPTGPWSIWFGCFNYGMRCPSGVQYCFENISSTTQHRRVDATEATEPLSPMPYRRPLCLRRPALGKSCRPHSAIPTVRWI